MASEAEQTPRRLQVELQDRRNLVAMRGSLAAQRAANAQREARFADADARRAELQARMSCVTQPQRICQQLRSP